MLTYNVMESKNQRTRVTLLIEHYFMNYEQLEDDENASMEDITRANYRISKYGVNSRHVD